MIRRAVFVFLFILIFGISSWAKGLSVSTSIFILSTVVKDIGKDKVKVSYVIPTSANPHIFSPTPKDLLSFSKADLFIGVGYDFEFWFNRVRFMRKEKPVLFLSEFYKNPIGSKRRFNPHIWLDAAFMENVGIDKITEKMCKIDKNDCEYFKKNAERLKNRLKDLIGRYKDLAEKDYCIVDVKPAFEYFLRSFNLKSCDVVIKEGSAMPSIKDLRGVINKCKCKKGVVIYINNVNVAKSVAEAKGYKTIQLNPLGNPSNKKENEYVKLLEYNLQKLQEALR
ncbi:metal ABC transporter substrate-binding protein [Hippea alviniae]|uniref:metal ABC transporter substrate-binding protein n=1 Tax=Hippea alviniae TaxID=1279027 RepID=UPI0003B6CADF|nr:metal ABC transporter substrate-binding protein [Hippea alviniae]